MLAPYLLAGAIGLCLGSFGNVFLYRMHVGKPLSGRSFCPGCKKKLRWFDLVPVLSFVLLGGKCRSCGASISIRYPFVELLSCSLFVFAMYMHMADPLAGFLTGFFLYFLLLACAYDASYQQIPDIFTMGVAVMAVLFLLLTGGDIVSGFFGAALGAAWFGAQWFLSRGKAVGSGDIFLAAAIGLFLGFRETAVMLSVSYMIGALVVVTLLSLKKISLKKGARIAFGPFLGVATLVTIGGVGDAYLSLLH